MAFAWPEFPVRVSIDAHRSWTAVHESFDERNLDAYYVVTLHRDGQVVGNIVAKLGMGFAAALPSWDGPAFPDEVRAEISRIAATGRSNTDYRGPGFAPIVTID